MGFGIMTSVVTNNVAVLGALANGMLPLRKVARLEAERRHRMELSQSCARERNARPITRSGSHDQTIAGRAGSRRTQHAHLRGHSAHDTSCLSATDSGAALK